MELLRVALPKLQRAWESLRALKPGESNIEYNRFVFGVAVLRQGVSMNDDYVAGIMTGEILKLSGIVRILLSFLKLEDSRASQIQYETCWIFRNICSTKSEYVEYLINRNLGEAMTMLITRTNLHKQVMIEALQTLVNIAGDGENPRDYVIKCRVVSPLLKIAEINSTRKRVFAATVRCIKNLVRGTNPYPDITVRKSLFPILRRAIHYTDNEIVSTAMCGLSYISHDHNEGIFLIIEEKEVLKRIVELLSHEEISVLLPAIKTIGYIVSGNDQWIDKTVKLNVISQLKGLLFHEHVGIRFHTIWCFSNIFASEMPKHIQELISGGSYDIISEIVMNSENMREVGEGIWCVSNIAATKVDCFDIQKMITPRLLRRIIEIGKERWDEYSETLFLKCYINGLFEKLLLKGEDLMKKKNLKENPYVAILEKEGGVEFMAFVYKNHQSEKIRERTITLLTKYFSKNDSVKEEEVEEVEKKEF